MQNLASLATMDMTEAPVHGGQPSHLATLLLPQEDIAAISQDRPVATVWQTATVFFLEGAPTPCNFADSRIIHAGGSFTPVHFVRGRLGDFSEILYKSPRIFGG